MFVLEFIVESQYQQSPLLLVYDFVDWCDKSCLCLNATKTKDMCIDFRNDPPFQSDTVIHEGKVEVVDE